VPPGPVVDGHLGDPRSLQLEQRRQETMHAREQRDAPQEFGAVDAQSAAGVGNGVARQPVAHAAGEARGRPAQPGVLPVGSDAADHVAVVEILQTIEEPGDVRRVVLQVGVEGDDDAAAGRAEARGQRRRLAGVAPQTDDAHAQVL
jgi:hypothetical protein